MFQTPGDHHTEYRFQRTCDALVIVPDSPAGGGLWPVTLALHGYGETAESFRTMLAPAIGLGDRVWVIPDGPLSLERRRAPGVGHAWYIFSGNQELMRRTMAESSVALRGLLDSLQNKLPVRQTEVSVIGFSQGGYLASMIWQHIPVVSSVCCIAGRLKQEWWPEELRSGAPRFLQLHGAEDMAVPPALARAAVDEALLRDFAVQMTTFPNVAHELVPAMLDHWHGWLVEGQA